MALKTNCPKTSLIIPNELHALSSLTGTGFFFLPSLALAFIFTPSWLLFRESHMHPGDKKAYQTSPAHCKLALVMSQPTVQRGMESAWYKYIHLDLLLYHGLRFSRISTKEKRETIEQNKSPVKVTSHGNLSIFNIFFYLSCLFI